MGSLCSSAFAWVACDGVNYIPGASIDVGGGFGAHV
jgi:hypothetical protein